MKFMLVILSVLLVIVLACLQLGYLSSFMGSALSFTRNMSNSVPRRPSTFTINPSGKHSATVIFLHGLGDTGQGWSMALQEIREPHIKYVCPTASAIPVTLNGGMRMPSWFDLHSLQIGGQEDSDGIRKAVKELVTELIAEEEAAGFPQKGSFWVDLARVKIQGVPLGGALALYSALTFPKRLAGVIALSCWLPLAGDFPKVHAALNKDIPVLICHGDSDPLVSAQVGQLTKAKLAEFVPNITAKVYRGLGHSSNEEEMADVKAFISKCTQF